MAVATETALPARPALDPEQVGQLGRSRNEPPWLVEFRLASLARCTPEAWPTGQEEEWRRFPLRDLPQGPLVASGGPEPEVRHEGLSADLAARGLVFGPWSDAVRDHPELVRRSLGDGTGLATHAASRALNGAAFAAGSTFVHVPAGLEVPVPLRAATHWPAGSGAMIPRLQIVAERGARVTVVEELSSAGGETRLAIPGVTIDLAEGASVRYVRIQRFAEDVWDLGYQDYRSGSDSVLASFNVLVGSGRSKVGVGSRMSGNGAEVRLYGLVAAGGTQRIDVNSLQQVDGRGATSDLLYLSALYEASKAVYYGVIRVEPTSSGSGSYQECRNMLLSDRAGADPIPVLEILTNDVARCGHGATAGALEDSELFYVMSRGLDRTAAEQLLVRGFFQRVIDNIPEAGVRARVLDALVPRIGRVAELDEASAA